MTALDNTVTELSQQGEQIQSYCFKLEERVAEMSLQKETLERDKQKLTAEVAFLN